jgi:Starch binding domain
VGALGTWSSDEGRALTEKAPGAWSATIILADERAVEFKFVKVSSGRAAQWEEWLPFDSNRSLLVDCAAEGGTFWVDAATDAGPANRAVGRSYGGAFNVRPLDATK